MGVTALRLLAVSLLALLLAAPAASARRDVPPGFYGMVWDGEELTSAPFDVREAQWGRMAEAGVESTRLIFSWDTAQPEAGATFDFERTDQDVEQATRHGQRILPVVIYAPPWARKHPREFGSPPRRASDYTAYLRALIRRYGPRGSFWRANPAVPKRPIREWQVWNEPNLRFQWNDREYVEGYSELLRASHTAIRRGDRRAKVVIAGLANNSWEVLEEMYERGRIKGSFDVAAVHPYTGSGARVLTVTKLYRRTMRRHGDAKLPLWLTEVGFPASKGKTDRRSPDLETTERGAASRLKRAYSLIISRRRQREVGVSRLYWYTWASSYREETFRFTGLFEYRGGFFREKPVYRAFRTSARRHQGCVKDARARCRR